CERAFASSNAAASYSCSVMTFALSSSSDRAFCASAVFMRASATARSASACANALRTSRGSTSPSTSPRFTASPVSTCSAVISPDAFDFTSTRRIGSIRPAASAVTSSERRSAATNSRAVSSVSSPPRRTMNALTAPSTTTSARTRFILFFIVTILSTSFHAPRRRLADRAMSTSILPTPADQRLQLRQRELVVVLRGDQIRFCRDQILLRCDMLENRRDSQAVALLLHAQVLQREGERLLRERDLLACRLERTDHALDVRPRRAPRILQLIPRNGRLYARRLVPLFAREAVEDREREAESQRPA